MSLRLKITIINNDKKQKKNIVEIRHVSQVRRAWTFHESELILLFGQCHLRHLIKHYRYCNFSLRILQNQIKHNFCSIRLWHHTCQKPDWSITCLVFCCLSFLSIGSET